MSTAEELKSLIAKEQQTIEQAKRAIKEYELDLERLKQSDVLCVGDRVRLKRSYDTDRDRKESTGWRAYLHFMNPNNPATIRAVSCYKGRIGYSLEFDDQTCYYSHPSSGRPTYRADGVFHFSADAITPIDKSVLQVRLTFTSGKWHEFKLTTIKAEYIEFLEDLKRAGAIKVYEIKEVKED